MSLLLKIVLIILTTIYSVFPSYFTAADTGNASISNRLTRYGWILFGIIILTIILSIVVEILNDKENSSKQSLLENSLNDIKLALNKSKLEYDPINKTIVDNSVRNNINYGFKGVDITVNDHGSMNGVNVVDNKFNQVEALDYYRLENSMKDYVDNNHISSKDVYLYALSGTNGELMFKDILKVLNQNSYRVIEQTTLPQNPTKIYSRGINFGTTGDKKLIIYVGSH